MHLLNCLLLKLYKHCRRSHCCCAPSPSASLYNERQGKRAHKKFRGHCIDGMLDGAPVAPLSDPPELHVLCFFCVWNGASGPERVQVKHYQHVRSATSTFIFPSENKARCCACCKIWWEKRTCAVKIQISLADKWVWSKTRFVSSVAGLNRSVSFWPDEEKQRRSENLYTVDCIVKWKSMNKKQSALNGSPSEPS